jgi:hypothetical protein
MLFSVPSRSAAQGICLASAPYAPTPLDQAEVIETEVTLSWRVDCAERVEVRVNGMIATTVESAMTQYAIKPKAGINEWQLIAIDTAGNRAESPVWRFVRDTESWLATPQALATDAVIYTPPVPPRIWIDVNSPSVLASLICGSACGGLGLVVVAAWFLGVRAQRRADRQRWYN